MRRNKRAFTLIELLVVISIIMFLLAFMTGVFLRATQSAKVKATAALIQKIGMALTQYQADFRCVPPDSGFGLPQNGGIVKGQVMYDAATLWRYLSQELTANGKAFGPYTHFSEYELLPIVDANGQNAFAVVDSWRTPVGYIGDTKRVMHNRDSFDIFSAGPDRKTAINDGIDNDGDGTIDSPSNRAYDGTGTGTSLELGEAALNGCLTGFRKSPKAGEVLDDINNWDPQN